MSFSQRAMPPSSGRVAVMVDQAAAPFAADVAVEAARDQARVLHRDHRLIVVAVERPGLDLALGAFAAMQQMMERMQAMIAPRADVAQSRFEFIGRQQCVIARSSIPSSATSKPAASTVRRCGEPSIRIGLVLLMWIKDSPPREARQRRRASRPGRRPACGPCGARSWSPAPAEIISSSVNSVPSNSTTSAPRSRASDAPASAWRRRE